MSPIDQVQKNIKKKLSLNDYKHTDTGQLASQTLVYEQGAEPITTTESNQQTKIKATYYLSEQDHAALTDLYIRRLQRKQKTDRSALVSEAIRLLYHKEIDGW